jgi:hypothetical protein
MRLCLSWFTFLCPAAREVNRRGSNGASDRLHFTPHAAGEIPVRDSRRQGRISGNNGGTARVTVHLALCRFGKFACRLAFANVAQISEARGLSQAPNDRTATFLDRKRALKTPVMNTGRNRYAIDHRFHVDEDAFGAEQREQCAGAQFAIEAMRDGQDDAVKMIEFR